MVLFRMALICDRAMGFLLWPPRPAIGDILDGKCQRAVAGEATRPNISVRNDDDDATDDAGEFADIIGSSRSR